MANACLEINIKVPFASKRLAEIAYDVLRIDAEPKRSGIKKELIVDGNVLTSKFTGESAKQLRVGVNCFFENISLILQTFEFAGPPVTETYSYS